MKKTSQIAYKDYTKMILFLFKGIREYTKGFSVFYAIQNIRILYDALYSKKEFCGITPLKFYITQEWTDEEISFATSYDFTFITTII